MRVGAMAKVHRRMVSAVAVILGLLVSVVPGSTSAIPGCGATGSAGSPGWSRPDKLGSRGYETSLTVTHPGTTTVAWRAGTYDHGPVHVRRQDAGKSWAQVEELGVATSFVGMAANRHDLTVAAWFQRRRDGNRLMVARRPAGGPWQQALAINRRVPSGRLAGTPEVAVSDSGATVVWWDEEVEEVDCGDRWWSYLTYATPAGTWEAPHEVGDRSCQGGMAAAAIGDRGNVNVAYRTASGLRFTRRIVGQGWTAPRPVTRQPSRFSPVFMRTPRGGTLVLAWERGDETGYEARRRIDGRWGPVRSWASKDAPEGDWDAAMDGGGTATLGWVDQDGVIRVKRWPPRGPMSAARTLVGPAGPTDEQRDELDVAAGAAGDAVVAFFAYVGAELHILYRPRAGLWRPQPVLRGPTGRSGYELAVRPSGAVDVTWIGEPDPGRRGVWHSRLTPSAHSR
jgi:hypothetical protein